MMLLLPVLSNRLGVIHGCRWRERDEEERKRKKVGDDAYFDQKPSTKADTADLLRPIREAGAERESNGKETSKEGISRNEHDPVL